MRKRKLNPCPSMLRRTTNLLELAELYREKADGIIKKWCIDQTVYRVKDFVAVTGKIDVREVTEEDFERFKQEKMKNEVKNISINSYFTSFLHFWGFLGIDLKLQYLQVDKDRIARLQKQVITNSEFTALLEVIDDLTFKAAIAILYERGIRVGEHSYKQGYPREGLLGLNWDDVDFEKCTMEIRLKGGKTQILPLGELSEKYLRELKESGNRGKIASMDPIFVSSWGRRMSYCHFHHKLSKYMESAGISKEKRHPHAFRHTCGTWITAVYGVYRAKQVLGHEHLQTTEIYVHLAGDDLMQKLRPDKADKKDEFSKPKMKECPKCGAQFTPDRKICICGYDFTQSRCHKCNSIIEKKAHFCPFCGTNLSPPQPECVCGRELRMDYKICPNCGRSVKDILALWKKKDFEIWGNLENQAPKEMTQDAVN
jgi:site-specific recombinase XerD/RNA polymerase subunit RPABC4/transcription elongation factor Spt4